jgi:hypothetical protein
MSVRPKPKPVSPQTDPDVDEFINAGGSTTKANTETIEQVEQPPTEAEPKPVKLRLPADLLEKIDAAVAKRRPKPSRHQWILEACYQKLERDEGE